MHFKINLTLISILVIVLFFNIPFYHNWLNTNLLNPSISYFNVQDQLGVEQRRDSRYGYSYMAYKELLKMCPRLQIDTPILLLPPEKFLREKGIVGLNVTEPMVYYYLTGQKAVWYDSPGVDKANCVLLPDNGKIVLKKINTPQELAELLTTFKKYKLDL